MIPMRIFLVFWSFSVLLLAADPQPSLRAVVADLRSRQSQAPTAVEIAAVWAAALPPLIAALPTAPAGELPGALQAFRDCPTHEGRRAAGCRAHPCSHSNAQPQHEATAGVEA